MRNRAIGLKAAVGYVGNLGPTDDFCVEFNAAFIIKRMLGSSVSLRASVMMELIRNRNARGPVGAVCSHVCEILNWAEMDDMVCIYDTLVLPKSHVLKDCRVLAEVGNIAEAYGVITQTNYPRHFKILCPTTVTNVMNKNRFPILLAVAQICKSDSHGTERSASSQTPLVDELVAIHHHNNLRHQGSHRLKV
ncbi:uncharacterized protein LOC105434816 [Cucumis sativus]|uniref:Uncharacterized protein n=1 Tax=Cucumis sativus TaxID=3659 RepID=A0A0A0L6A6_CUCSA|nr:uncharacterized protein LOC105434816 [Cucumis sativus]XP_031737794.1 uncharacterized protein LOC105434816 [Cucumis sativus]KGN56529.1 hypothetical protein Csa_010129 [Cucumis sativus]